MTTLYIAGPMTDRPRSNVASFDGATAALERAGFQTFTPFDMMNKTELEVCLRSGPGAPADHPEVDPVRIFKNNIDAVFDADGLAMLPGWRQSLGCLFEVAAAQRIDKRVATVEAWLAGFDTSIDLRTITQGHDQ